MKHWFKWILFVLLVFICGCNRNRAPTPKNVDIRIAFGYKDTRPTQFVGDRYERLYLIQYLTRNCSQLKNLICGFVRDEHDGDSLLRVFNVTKTNVVQVRIKITPSSVGPDDEQNRLNPYQEIQSAISENNLLSGLNSAQAIFYIGHSRDGGGPDFKPPQLTPSKEVDFNWYRTNKPGLQKLLEEIRSSKNTQPQTFGMLSCLSSKHFEQSIYSLTKRIRFVSTKKLIYYTEALDQSLREVSKVIREQLLTATSGASTPKTLSF